MQIRCPLGHRQIKLWYAQGGVKTRFDPWDDAPDVETVKDQQTWAGKTRCKTSKNSCCQLELV